MRALVPAPGFRPRGASVPHRLRKAPRQGHGRRSGCCSASRLRETRRSGSCRRCRSSSATTTRGRSPRSFAFAWKESGLSPPAPCSPARPTGPREVAARLHPRVLEGPRGWPEQSGRLAKVVHGCGLPVAVGSAEDYLCWRRRSWMRRALQIASLLALLGMAESPGRGFGGGTSERSMARHDTEVQLADRLAYAHADGTPDCQERACPDRGGVVSEASLGGPRHGQPARDTKTTPNGSESTVSKAASAARAPKTTGARRCFSIIEGEQDENVRVGNRRPPGARFVR